MLMFSTEQQARLDKETIIRASYTKNTPHASQRDLVEALTLADTFIF